MSLRQNATHLERALIEALGHRYKENLPADLMPLNIEYSEEMAKVYYSSPKNQNVTALYVESLMLLAPWKLWEKSTPTELLNVIIPAVADTENPHPALYHQFIHIMEISPDPFIASNIARRLQNLVPDAGHLVHMGTHITVMEGEYEYTILGNILAVEAGERFKKFDGILTSYTQYRLHDIHFVIFAAMFDAQFNVAIKYARKIIEEIPPEYFLSHLAAVESFICLPFHVLVRFGKWREILAEPIPSDETLYPNTIAIAHYARGIAHAVLGQIPEAELENKLFLEAKSRVPERHTLFINKVVDQLAIAESMLAGEICYRKLEFHKAFEFLENAVKLCDRLVSWGWMQPPRHALAGLLLEQGHMTLSEKYFLEDLQKHPKNCWSLVGLLECVKRRNGNADEIQKLEGEVKLALARADVPVKASCYCVIGTSNCCC